MKLKKLKKKNLRQRDFSGTRDFFGNHGDDGGGRNVCEEGCVRFPRWCVQLAEYTMDLPETIRRRLEDFSRNVLFDQSRAGPFSQENNTFAAHGGSSSTSS